MHLECVLIRATLPLSTFSTGCSFVQSFGDEDDQEQFSESVATTGCSR